MVNVSFTDSIYSYLSNGVSEFYNSVDGSKVVNYVASCLAIKAIFDHSVFADTIEIQNGRILLGKQLYIFSGALIGREAASCDSVAQKILFYSLGGLCMVLPLIKN